MDVSFETQSGSTFSIELGYWDTVLEIKQKIEKYQRIPVSNQTIFKGDVLLQDDLTIEQCVILHNSRLHLFVSPNDNQVVHQSPVPSNSIGVGDIIYGKDFPLTAEQFSSIQAFRPFTTKTTINGKDSPPLTSAEQIVKDQDSLVTAGCNKNDQVLPIEKSLQSNSTNEIITVQDSPPSNFTEQIIENQDSPVAGERNKNDQVLPTEKSLQSNSTNKIINGQDSSPSNFTEKIIKNQDSTVTVEREKNEQVLLTEKSLPSNFMNSQDSIWRPVKVRKINKPVAIRMTVFVLLYSGTETKAKNKIPVDVYSTDNVKELRKELVKIQLNLPQEGYFFTHKHNVMVEDRSFSSNDVHSCDIIEIIPSSVTRGS